MFLSQVTLLSLGTGTSGNGSGGTAQIQTTRTATLRASFWGETAPSNLGDTTWWNDLQLERKRNFGEASMNPNETSNESGKDLFFLFFLDFL